MLYNTFIEVWRVKVHKEQSPLSSNLPKNLLTNWVVEIEEVRETMRHKETLFLSTEEQLWTVPMQRMIQITSSLMVSIWDGKKDHRILWDSLCFFLQMCMSPLFYWSFSKPQGFWGSCITHFNIFFITMSSKMYIC